MPCTSPDRTQSLFFPVSLMASSASTPGLRFSSGPRFYHKNNVYFVLSSPLTQTRNPLCLGIPSYPTSCFRSLKIKPISVSCNFPTLLLQFLPNPLHSFPPIFSWLTEISEKLEFTALQGNSCEAMKGNILKRKNKKRLETGVKRFCLRHQTVATLAVKALSRLQTGNARTKFTVQWKEFLSVRKLHGFAVSFVTADTSSP